MQKVKIIGAGLAGSEAAWQCARRGVAVELCEMRPVRSTPAHQTADFAELVCSNSLKSESENTASPGNGLACGSQQARTTQVACASA